jgi:hypothetical protein
MEMFSGCSAFQNGPEVKLVMLLASWANCLSVLSEVAALLLIGVT